MNKPLYDFFEKDHRRIDALLDRSIERPDHIDMHCYQDFRIGLLTHIKMEEKILFPAAQMANGGTPLPEFGQLRLEHGALTSLMVPPPTIELIKVIRYVIEVHDQKEEKPGGIYDVCEELTRDQTDDLISRLKETTPTPLHPTNKAEYALEAAKRSLLRAGYDYDQIAAM